MILLMKLSSAFQLQAVVCIPLLLILAYTHCCNLSALIPVKLRNLELVVWLESAYNKWYKQSNPDTWKKYDVCRSVQENHFSAWIDVSTQSCRVFSIITFNLFLIFLDGIMQHNNIRKKENVMVQKWPFYKDILKDDKEDFRNVDHFIYRHPKRQQRFQKC